MRVILLLLVVSISVLACNEVAEDIALTTSNVSDYLVQDEEDEQETHDTSQSTTSPVSEETNQSVMNTTMPEIEATPFEFDMNLVHECIREIRLEKNSYIQGRIAVHYIDESTVTEKTAEEVIKDLAQYGLNWTEPQNHWKSTYTFITVPVPVGSELEWVCKLRQTGTFPSVFLSVVVPVG